MFMKILLRILLLRLSKYLGIDLNYFAKDASYILTAHIVSLITGFFLTIAFARGLSQTTFGQYNFILAIVGTLFVFSLPGLDASITIASAHNRDGFYKRAIKSKLKLSFFGVFILMLIALYFFKRHDPHLAIPLLVSTIFFIPFYVFSSYLSFLNGKKLFRPYSIYKIISRVSITSFIIIVIFLSKNLTLVILCWFGVAGLLNLYFFKKTLKLRKNDIQDSELLNYGKHLTVIELISSTLAQFDKLIVTYFLGFVDLAVYAIAQVTPDQLKNLVKTMIPLVVPTFAVLDSKHLYRKVRSKMWIIFLLTLVASLVGIILVPYFIPLLYGNNYSSSVFYAQLLFLSMIFAVPATFIMHAILVPQKRKKSLYFINTSIPLINIVLLLFLIPKFGLIGAVLSIVISRLLNFVFVFVAMQKLRI